jgi:hypothetical protein
LISPAGAIRVGDTVAIIDLFRKYREKSKQQATSSAGQRGKPAAAPVRSLVRIEFDMMLKGSVYDRPSGRVRQYGVTVDGSTRVITSGDFVDRDTYDALLRAGAIRPKADNPPPDRPVTGPPRRRAS